MSIVAEPFKEDKGLFPEGKIILTDGRVLDCYPLTEQKPEKIESDSLELDLTGQYLTIGRRKPTPVPKPSATVEELRQLFVSNAFYLLAHKERILSDSRMFLCPVAIQNGIAYTGTSGFRKPTLGVYLEWWVLVKEAMHIDKNDCRSLVYQLAGSPLSGRNCCSAVREDGKTETVSLSSFNRHWGPFMHLNQRYTEAKQLYQAYTLQEVLDILHMEDDNSKADFSVMIDVQFMKHEIELLNQRIEAIKEECNRWHDKYEDALTRYNAEEMRQVYADCEAFEAQVTKEIDALKAQKKELKANLKRGRLDNVSYQRQLTPLKKRISDLFFQISRYTHEKIQDTFPDEKDINFSMITKYFSKKE